MNNTLDELHKSAAKTFARLSLGVLGVSFVGKTDWSTWFLVIFGFLFALTALYIVLPIVKGRQTFFNKFATKAHLNIYETIGWFIALAMFGYGIFKTGFKWGAILALIFFGVSYIILLFGIYSSSKIKE